MLDTIIKITFSFCIFLNIAAACVLSLTLRAAAASPPDFSAVEKAIQHEMKTLSAKKNGARGFAGIDC